MSSEEVCEICRIIYERKDFCKILLSENGDAAFFESLTSLGKGMIMEGWRRQGIDLPDEKMEMFFAYIVNGSIAMIQPMVEGSLQLGQTVLIKK